MRNVCSYAGILSASLLTTVAANSATPVSTAGSSAKVIKGLPNAQHFHSPSKGQFYVQAGTFRSAKNAESYKNQLARKFNYRVYVKALHNYHVVFIGPINSASEVRMVGSGTTVIPVSAKQQIKAGSIRDKNGLLEPVLTPSRLEFIGALGVANIKTDNSRLGVTLLETNTLVPSKNRRRAFAAQLGAGYVFYLGDAQRYSEQWQWFPSVQPQINGYYLNGNSSIQDQVWHFESPEYNDLTFKSSLQSQRLMVDAALTILSRKQYSLFAISGIGYAWNRLSYQGRDKDPHPSAFSNLNLNSKTHSNFAWEVGGGFIYSFNDRIAATLQYLYTDLGDAGTSTNGTHEGVSSPVIVAPHVDLQAQTVSLGIKVAV